MSEASVTTSKRRSAHDDAQHASAEQDLAGTRKRRAFLRTMGQQLREFGNDGTSPQQHSRNTFGTSPDLNLNARPSSRATNVPTNRASIHVDSPESDAAPGEHDQLPAGVAKSASKWLWASNEVLSLSLPNAQPFAFEHLLEWSQSYFDHWHPAFPFFHAPSLLDYFRLVTQHGLPTAVMSPSNIFHHVILRSVMSISVADRRQMRSPTKSLPSSLVFHSFNDAIISVQSVLTDESSIVSLQALISVQLFLITMHRYNAASRLQGVAVRIAFQLRLHRCPVPVPTNSNKEVELRKRLFWSVYCIDRYICIRLGNPLGIRSDDMDVCYPRAERHVDADDKENEPDDDRLQLFDFLARHANIRGSIMENRQRSAIKGGQNEFEKQMEAEADHTKWWNIVDEYLSDSEQTQAISKMHQVILIVLRFETILALHRSVLATSNKNAAYNAALQRCIAASRSVINTLHRALTGFGAFDGSPGQRGYEVIPLVWPSFTWAVWMSAFIVFSAATEHQVSKEVTLKLADKSVDILKHLALRGTGWPDACITAIQNLQARLRGSSTRSSTVAPQDTLESRGSVNPPVAGGSGANLQSNRRARYSQVDQGDSAQPRHAVLSTVRGPSASALVAGFSSSHLPQPHYNSYSAAITNTTDVLNYPSSPMQHSTNQDPVSLANAHFAGSGTFLGIAQQFSDNPLPNDDIMHLFNGEDITDWSGVDFGFHWQS